MPIVLMLLTTLVTLYLRTERKIALLALTVAALLGCGWHGWSLWAIIPSALLLGLALAASGIAVLTLLLAIAATPVRARRVCCAACAL